MFVLCLRNVRVSSSLHTNLMLLFADIFRLFSGSFSGCSRFMYVLIYLLRLFPLHLVFTNFPNSAKHEKVLVIFSDFFF